MVENGRFYTKDLEMDLGLQISTLIVTISQTTISWEYDKKAFVFSLVNKENKPMLFEQKSDGLSKNSTTSFKEHGPEFGEGHDIFIADDSNLNTRSFSNLGKTYTHPEYPYDSIRAQTILAVSHNFQVQEIEVFQMQQ